MSTTWTIRKTDIFRALAGSVSVSPPLVLRNGPGGLTLGINQPTWISRARITAAIRSGSAPAGQPTRPTDWTYDFTLIDEPIVEPQTGVVPLIRPFVGEVAILPAAAGDLALAILNLEAAGASRYELWILTEKLDYGTCETP